MKVMKAALVPCLSFALAVGCTEQSPGTESVSPDELGLFATAYEELDRLVESTAAAQSLEEFRALHLACSLVEQRIRPHAHTEEGRQFLVRWNRDCQIGVRHALARQAAADGHSPGICTDARWGLEFLISRRRAVAESRQLLANLDAACGRPLSHEE